MADTTGISWTDATFNPWIGCTKVSPGCDNCYAARQDAFRHWTSAGWGAGQPRKRTAPANWKQPEKWNADPFKECTVCGWRGGEADLDRMYREHPGGWLCCEHRDLQPARRRVFCSSLADVFDNEVDPAWRVDLFALIAATPNLDWLLLTKRIGNAARMLADVHIALGEKDESKLPRWPWPNVWLGATVVNQEEADRDIPKLLATPARVRFLSMEPLLGPVDLMKAGDPLCRCGGCLSMAQSYPESPGLQRIDWIITGGESGPKARPSHPDWFRSLRDQCAAAGVPYHFKQWGEWMPIGQQPNGDGPGCSDHDAYTKAQRCALQLDGEIRDAWPAGAMLMRRIGVKAAGRLLDGVEHNGFPEVACAT